MSETDQGHTEATPTETSGAEQNVVGKSTLTAAAVIMAFPALVPLLVAIEPSLVPFINEVDTSSTGTVLFLVGMSLVLLIANWGFLYAIYRWLNKYGAR